MSDTQIIEAITVQFPDKRQMLRSAESMLVALRYAGYEVVPADIAKLGRSVAEFQAPDWRDPDYYLAIIDIYEQAGVERPPGTP